MNTWGRRTFIIALVGALVVFARTLSDYATPVLTGLMLVVLAQPLGDALRRRLPRHKGFAAFLATLAAFIGLAIPLGLFVAFVARELVTLVARAQEFFAQGGSARLSAHLDALNAWLPKSVRAHLPDPSTLLDNLIGTTGRWAAGQIADVAQTAGNVFIAGFITFVTAYYLFLDGRAFGRKLERLVPFSEHDARVLYVEFRNMIVAVFYVTGIVGVVQGALTSLTFIIVGLPDPFVWGALTIVASFIPLIGSGLVWLPAGFILLVLGKTWQALFMWAVGMFVIGSVDNVLRPLLVKGRVRVHQLIIFLSIFGGISTFGAIGVVLGPVVASLTMALLGIWERDFVGPESEEAPAPTAAKSALAALQSSAKSLSRAQASSPPDRSPSPPPHGFD